MLSTASRMKRSTSSSGASIGPCGDIERQARKRLFRCQLGDSRRMSDDHIVRTMTVERIDPFRNDATGIAKLLNLGCKASSTPLMRRYRWAVQLCTLPQIGASPGFVQAIREAVLGKVNISFPPSRPPHRSQMILL